MFSSDWWKLPSIVSNELGLDEENVYLLSLSTNAYAVLNDENEEFPQQTRKNIEEIQEDINKALKPRIEWINKNHKRKHDDDDDIRGNLNNVVVNYSSSLTDYEPFKKKTRKLSATVADDPISYESIIRNHVHCKEKLEQRIVNRLAHNAYHQNINYSTAYPIIQRFVDKSIENSMAPRMSKSKMKTKKEKHLEKNFILDLQQNNVTRDFFTFPSSS